MCKIVQCSILVLAMLLAPQQAMGQADAGAHGPATMHPLGDWPRDVTARSQASTVAELVAMADAFPHSGSVRLRLLNALLEAGDRQAALVQVRWLLARGHRFGPEGRAMLADLFPGEDLGSDTADRAARPSTLHATVPASALLVETALHDPVYDRTFATAIVSRGLFVQEADGPWRRVEIAAAGSLSGMALDQERGLLWLASGVVEQTPDPDTAFRGLIALDRATLAEVRRVAVAQVAFGESSPGDIAVLPDGSVLASDLHDGAILSLVPDSDRIRQALPPLFRSPQGIAAGIGSVEFYVSDYRYGLARVRGRVVDQVVTDLPVLLDGIDGLWRVGNELVAMRNGTSPMAVVAYRLSDDGARIVGFRVLETEGADWTEPLGGNVAGDRLVYVATGQWDRFGPGGQAVDAAATGPTQLRSLAIVADGGPESP